MEGVIWISESNKSGLHSPESYVVGRGAISFLRLLGKDPQWELMTATASEDNGHVQVCGDRIRVLQAAIGLSAEYKTTPAFKRDFKGREYVSICGVDRGGQGQPELLGELGRLFEAFFRIYDECHTPDSGSSSANEMRELYASLATNEDSGDIYLSDGVWLSSDGSMHDRGR